MVAYIYIEAQRLYTKRHSQVTYDSNTNTLTPSKQFPQTQGRVPKTNLIL